MQWQRLSGVMPLLVGIIGLGWSSLTRAEESGPAGLAFFESRIRPVLVERCHECHGPKKQEAGLRLDSLPAILQGGDSGPALVPGKPETSLIVGAIRYEDYEMPPTGQLPANQIADFVAWIRMGAPWPKDEVADSEAKRRAQELAWKNHWAFQPLQQPTIPDLPDLAANLPAVWHDHPIDRFLLAQAAQQEPTLIPAPQADRRTLLRRLTFSLHGLPPTPAEMKQYLDSELPDAYEQVVDRLLASPHYGERWGRFWLDLARYADTKGYIYADRMEKRFIHSHVYRDWVIQAFNDDMPYDEFLRLQLAADQIADQPEDLAALGFLTLGRWQLGVMPDIIDDRIDTVMRTTQALTVSCARCHDHKYDPIPTADYYSLYGIFSGCYEERTPIQPLSTGSTAFVAGLRERQERLQAGMTKASQELAERVRGRIADYLMLQPKVDELPGDEVYLDLQGGDLVPAVARRWQLYLSTRHDDPVWFAWHRFAELPEDQFAVAAANIWREVMRAPATTVHPVIQQALADAPPTSLREVAESYARALELANKPEAEQQPELAALREVLFGATSPCRPPAVPLNELNWYLPEVDRVGLGKLEAEVERWIVEAANPVPHATILTDRPEQRPQRIFRRGNPANRGSVVERQYLQCVAGAERQPFTQGSGRRELAAAITAPNNPLTARVLVNRVWQFHFGAGLVRTPSDFGTRGQPPTHPELLDWLANEFMVHGWSMKHLHRLILTSAAYRQTTAPGDPASIQRDPENKLWMRQNRQRLDFETLRDSLLFVSGELDLTIGGQPEPMFGHAFSPRRTIYGYLDRQFVPTELVTFDMASTDVHTADRFETTVAPQALFLLNSQFLAARARQLVSRVSSSVEPAKGEEIAAQRIRQMYQFLFQRDPSKRELALGLHFTNNAAGPGILPVVSAGVTTRNGAWQRHGDELVQISSDTDVGLFFGDPSWTNYTVEVEAQLQAGEDGPQIAVRVNGPREMYWTYFGSYGGQRHGAAWESGERLEDVGGAGKEGKLEFGKWYPLKVEMRDDRCKCYFNGQLVHEFQDGRYKNGRIGLGAWASQVRYRNLIVRDTDNQVIFVGLPEPPGGPLAVWEQYAQVLLLANEFIFVD